MRGLGLPRDSEQPLKYNSAVVHERHAETYHAASKSAIHLCWYQQLSPRPNRSNASEKQREPRYDTDISGQLVGREDFIAEERGDLGLVGVGE